MSSLPLPVPAPISPLSRPLRVALIGCGIFARENYIPHIRSATAAGLLEFTAILSRTEEALEEFLTILNKENESNSFNSIERFIGSTGEGEFYSRANSICDAVCIVVPIDLLEHFIERSLRSNLHILSEKPICLSSSSGQRLIEIYRNELNSSTIWSVAENYRFEPAIKFSSEYIKMNGMPKSFTLLVIRQQKSDAKFFKRPWRSQPNYRGASVFDGGIHFVALIRAVLGGNEIKNIRGFYEAEDNVEVGAVGGCRIGSSFGTYQIRYGKFEKIQAKLECDWANGDKMIISQIPGKGYRVEINGINENIIREFPTTGLVEEFDHWLRACRGQENIPQELIPEESLKDLQAIEMICNQN